MIKNLARRALRRAGALAERELLLRFNENLAISAAIAESRGISTLNYPVSYVAFLRDCTQRQRHRIKPIKGEPALYDAGKRFTTLLDVLGSEVPAIPFKVAQEIGRVADGFESMWETKAAHDWIGDIGLHFTMSSSFGRKGRLLSAIVRYMGAQNCLEVGTAYGMSALFILWGLAARGHLTTVEAGRQQFESASNMLKTRYGESVSCHFGSSVDVLTHLCESLDGLDFVFHDASHTREMYLKDFGAMQPMLKRGTVILVDDIYWNDPRFHKGAAEAHDGWLKLVSHPSIHQAVEIDDALGLALLK